MTRSLFALASAIMVLAGLPSAAHAIDCARASAPIDHTICDDSTLRRADSALGRAYAAILKAAPDPEIHAMLIASQKRWIAARDRTYGGDGRTGKTALEPLLLDAIETRTKVLTRMSKDTPRRPVLIQTALRQRQFAAQFSGGAFAGFDTSCDFFPSDPSDQGGEYQCFATHHLQNHDRICSQQLDWATYRIYATQSVANVVEGKPKLVALCKDDGCGDDATGAKAGWNRHPDAASAGAFPRSLPQLDAEVIDSMVDDEPSWLKACLTDERFPRAVSGR